jgi:RNA polymerase sigma factor (TIGR02999 family)
MDSATATKLTGLMDSAAAGDPIAARDLLPLVYDELRELARKRIAGERPGCTLQPTALVHEAYLRLAAGAGAEVKWQSRRHFYAAAATAMRRILIDRARALAGPKRGADRRRIPLSEAEIGIESRSVELLDLDEALSALEKEDPQLSELVTLRYFAGLSVDETAAALGVAPRTVDRDWRCAKAWLFDFLSSRAKQTEA